jgi:hypothetical protein
LHLARSLIPEFDRGSDRPEKWPHLTFASAAQAEFNERISLYKPSTNPELLPGKVSTSSQGS